MNRARGFVFATAVLGADVSAVYVKVVRPWALRWGATDQEAARRLPGDGVVQRADFVATRATTIHATADQGWPWLVQIGSGRAGWYSYDRLDSHRPRRLGPLPEPGHGTKRRKGGSDGTPA